MDNKIAKRPGTPEATAPTPMRRAAGPLAVAAALLALWLAGLFDTLTLDRLLAERERLSALVAARPLLAIAAYMAIYAGLVAISFPGASLLTIVAGFLFGWPVAGPATVAAATVGACMVFLLARSSAGDLLTRRAGPFAARMAEGFNANAFFYLLSLRLAPVFPFWAVNIAPALFGMRLAPYAAATFLGIIPATFIFTWLGSGIESAIAAREADNPGCLARGECSIDPASLATPQMLAGLLALAGISILPILARRLRRG
jgi:uncharacterized membrane protein YdjX (TVP38/TMEM64 family)